MSFEKLFGLTAEASFQMLHMMGIHIYVRSTRLRMKTNECEYAFFRGTRARLTISTY